MGRMVGHQDSQGKEAMLSTCGRLMTMQLPYSFPYKFAVRVHKETIKRASDQFAHMHCGLGRLLAFG